eukprot:338145-Amphidinium_carterae.1
MCSGRGRCQAAQSARVRRHSHKMWWTLAGEEQVEQRPSPLPRWREARSAVHTAPAWSVTRNFASRGSSVPKAPRSRVRLRAGSWRMSLRRSAARCHSACRINSRQSWGEPSWSITSEWEW